MEFFNWETCITPSTWCVVNNFEEMPILEVILYRLKRRFQQNFEFADTPKYTCNSYDKNEIESICDKQLEHRQNLSSSLIVNARKITRFLEDLIANKRHYNMSIFITLENWKNWKTHIDYLVWFPRSHNYK